MTSETAFIVPDDYLTELSDGNVSHRYLYIGGPLETPKQHVELFFAIGNEAASWARMEQHIDAIIVQINKAVHSNDDLDLFDEDHPRPFSDKLKMLRRYFSKHPGLKKYEPKVTDFCNGIKKIAEQRNHLMHGVLENFDPVKRSFTVNGMKYRKKTKSFQNLKEDHSLDTLHEVAHLTNIAHYGFCEVSQELFTPEGLAPLRMQPPQTQRWWSRWFHRLFR